jgi:hypothetical protein
MDKKGVFSLDTPSPSVCLMVQLEKPATEEGGVTPSVYSRKDPVSLLVFWGIYIYTLIYVRIFIVWRDHKLVFLFEGIMTNGRLFHSFIETCNKR